MLNRLSELNGHEERLLANYALRSAGSRGRRHPEDGHAFRTDFQRDRDRILHSRPFRRLEYKTQVFLSGSGDHYRTRLTHTIEVAAIARTIARALGLNEDLAETISLAHDIGHTPFGHSGEKELNNLMAGHGGFDHNDQALKIVDSLERKYPDFDGLNLTWEVRNGLVKHRSGREVFLDGEELPPSPSLESQTADIADDLTYYGHDVDDGLDANLLSEDALESLPIWMQAVKQTLERGIDRKSDKFKPYAVRWLIDNMVGDVIRNSACLIEESGVATPAEPQSIGRRLVSFSPEFQKTTDDLRAFLYENLYFCDSVSKVNSRASGAMRDLFNIYAETPDLMGKATQARIERDGLMRAVADYIAGMTDRYALIEHERLLKR